MKIGLYTGRFQYFHAGHEEVIRRAITERAYDHVVVLLGSCNVSRSPKNPFTPEERELIIKTSLSDDLRAKTSFRRINDYPLSDRRWACELLRVAVDAVNLIINGNGFHVDGYRNHDVRIIGSVRDEDTGSYLDTIQSTTGFPLDLIQGTNAELSGTALRDALYKNPFDVHALTREAKVFILKRTDEVWFEEIKAWNDALEDECHQLSHLKYPPVFVCGDALVTKYIEDKRHVLLVTRRSKMGHGLLALPGGHVDRNETISRCCARELFEETSIKIRDPENNKQYSIDSFARRHAPTMFDSPRRSERHPRIITGVMWYHVHERLEVMLTAADDASEARFYDFYELPPCVFYEDHWHIIDQMLRESN